MIRHEPLDIFGDAGVRAFGRSLPELFENSAEGLYGLITDIERIDEKRSVEIRAEAQSLESLLVSWLNELVFEFDANGFVGRKAEVVELSDNKIVATVSGEDFDPQRHERRLLVKAATYHSMKLEKKDGIWIAEIIFDI